MESKKVQELKSIAKELGLSSYSRLKKHKIIPKIQDFQDKQRNSSHILDEPVPEINIPIKKPTRLTAGKMASLKSLNGKIAKQVTRKINKFADRIISCIPKPIRNTVNEKADKLKNDIKSIFAQVEKLEPKQKQMPFNTYLNTFRVNGVEGYDPKTFIMISKPKVLNLIENQKKLIKLKFIFTCKFINEKKSYWSNR